MANKNRTKGHNAEREYAHLMRTLGYGKCQTTRYGSRLLDDCGVDLMNVPFNVQIKAGKHKGMKYQSVIKYTKDRMEELLSPEAPEKNLPTIIIHKLDVGQGKHRTEYDSLVILTVNDFEKLIKQQQDGTSKKYEARDPRVLSEPCDESELSEESK